MTILKFDVKTNQLEAVAVEPTLENLYQLIGCNLVDYRILTDEVSVVVDDEGLLKYGAVLSNIFIPGQPVVSLAGNLVFVGTNLETGETTPLRPEDVTMIQNEWMIL